MKLFTTVRAAVLAVVLCGATAARAQIVWDGGGADNNWSTAANWAGDVVPATTDAVLFDATSAKDCTVDGDVTVGGITLDSTYSGTVAAGSSNITVQSGNWTLSGGTFDPGTGTVDFYVASGARRLITGQTTFYNLTLSSGNVAHPIDISGDLVVQNDFTVATTYGYDSPMIDALNTETHTISVAGNVLHIGNHPMEAELTIIMNGTGAQTVTTSGDPSRGKLGSLQISNTSAAGVSLGDNLLLYGNLTIDPGATLDVTASNYNITLSGNWTRNGTFTQRQGTVDFDQSLGNSVIITGQTTFYNLTFSGDAYTTDVSDDLTVLNDFNISMSYGYASPFIRALDTETHTISVAGNVSQTGSLAMEPELTIVMNGTTAQTISTTGYHVAKDIYGKIGSLRISNTSADVTLSDTLRLYAGSSLAIDAGGVLDLAGYDLTGVSSFTNDGTLKLQGTETIGWTQDADSGTWRYTGDGAGGAAAFAVTEFGVTDYFNLEFAGRSDETFMVSGDLGVAGTFKFEEPTTVEFQGSNTLTVTGTFSANQATVLPSSRATIRAAAANYFTLNLSGGLDDTDTPNYVTFENLNAASAGDGGVTVAVNSDVIWMGVTFTNLSGTHSGAFYYLKTTGTAKLTLLDVTFEDKVGGVAGDGSFQSGSDPGTVSTSSTAAVAADVLTFTGIGGEATDDPTVGVDEKIVWSVWSGTRFWVGGTGNWSEASRWSTTSGGAGGASVPDTSSLVIFDANSGTGTCIIDVDAGIGSLILVAGYTGTLSLGARTVTLAGSVFIDPAAGLDSGTSTVIMTGAGATGDQSVTTNGSAFYNVEVTNTAGTVTFQDAQDITTLTANAATADISIEFKEGLTHVIDDLGLTGTAPYHVILRSTTDGVQWGLIVDSSETVTGVDVKDSDASSSAAAIEAMDPSNAHSGNNLNWTFWAATIAATDDYALENSTDTGLFTVTRTGADPGTVLKVYYTVGGTAGESVLYATLLREVDIPSSQNSATITVTPLNDALAAGARTVVVTLTATAEYVLGAAFVATVTIGDDDSPPEVFILTSPSGTGVQVDDASGVPVPVTLSWERPLGATSYTVEVSDDPSDWTSPVFTVTLLDADLSGPLEWQVPAGTLSYLTSYWWRVTAINGVAPDTLATNDPLSFETEPDTVAPTVVRTQPDHGDSRLEPDVVVTVRFSEAMDHGATESAFSITPPVGVGIFSWSTVGNSDVLTFTPPAELDWGTTYTVTITTGPGATDTAATPNQLDASNSPVAAGGDYSFSFTTAEALRGLAAGDGCLPGLPVGQTGAGLGLAVVALAAAGRLLRRRG